MKIIFITLLLILSVFQNTYAKDSFKEIETLINQALESNDLNHANWYKAAELLDPLLKSKNPEAIYYSAFLYAYGVAGYPNDPDKALKLEIEAAESGSVTAMYIQARRNEHGFSYNKNSIKAVYWYQKAAESGSEGASRRLAKAYKNGELGLTPNQELADKWKQIAGECKKP